MAYQSVMGPPLIPMSSMTDPRAMNYGGTLLPMSSQTDPRAANYQGTMRPIRTTAPTPAPTVKTTSPVASAPALQQTQAAPAGESEPVPEDLYRQQVEGAINASFEPIFAQLDQMAGVLPGQKGELLGNVASMRDTSAQGLEISKGAELSEMASAKEQLRAKTAGAKRETDTSMRNALLAGQIYLGSQGGGSSSAVDRYSGALAKSAGRNTALVQNKANEIWNQIVQKESDIRTTFELAINNLDQWKNEKTSEISQWYFDRLADIDNQRLTATGEKATALANLAVNAYGAALQRLTNLQNEARSYQQGIESWIAERSKSVADFKAQLAQIGQTPDMTLPQTTIPGISQNPAPQTTTGGGFVTPAQQQIKSEEDNLRAFLS